MRTVRKKRLPCDIYEDSQSSGRGQGGRVPFQLENISPPVA